jgi:integrase
VTPAGKPEKPSPDFPLFPHATRRWAKKIKQKMHYFGKWEDPDGALIEYQNFLASGKKHKTQKQTRTQTAGDKPEKPRPDFPLFPHASGTWAKKIRGKMHYFAPWDDPAGAERKYNEQKEALHAGRKVREDAGGYTVKQLCNDFYDAKEVLVGSGELTPRTLQNYDDANMLVLAKFGGSRLVADLDPDDFAALRKVMVDKKWSAVTVAGYVLRVRVLFKFAFDNGSIDRPVRYGQNFKAPSQKKLRLDRAKKGHKLFTAEEVRALIDGALVVGKRGPELVQAGPVMRAMVLLGINCGFGNADCGRLTKSNLDLAAGVIDYPRPKTGIQRRCVLWPETVAALRAALAIRPEPKDPADDDLVFITVRGAPWAKDTADQTQSKEFGKILHAFGFNGRTGLGCYTLRHTFRTIADEAKDQPAADYIMGHEGPHMSTVYRETISDERLKAVAEHVREWLYGAGEKVEEPKTKDKKQKRSV